jgi:PAS domain S-box-containing protein
MDPLLDSAPCGFASFADDGTLRDVNSTLAALLGYTRVELEGWHVQKILAPGTRVFYHTHLFPLLKLRGSVEEIYLALRAKDGGDVPVLMNAVRRERAGVFVSDSVFVHVVQRNRYEDELLQARRVAEEVSAAKAQFLSMMSHDLRTPLTSILGHAKLLAGGVYGPVVEEQGVGLARITDAGYELLRMINDVLAFAQLDSGRLELQLRPVPVRDAIQRAEVLVRLRIEEGGLAFAAPECDGLAVLADADRLHQILLNLLTNAIKFTPSGGRVAVRCERTGERVRIHVEDTGIGIPAEQAERVFEPFVQVGPRTTEQHGVGLGLAISRNLAQAMQGELSLRSVAGEGSVFTLELGAAS